MMKKKKKKIEKMYIFKLNVVKSQKKKELRREKKIQVSSRKERK